MKNIKITARKGTLTISDCYAVTNQTPNEEVLQIAEDWFLKDWSNHGLSGWDEIIVEEWKI